MDSTEAKRMTDENWKQRLTPEQYHVLREKDTEPAFTGEYVGHHEDGMYHCAACGASLFSSESKFESGTGWPSFYDVATKGNVELHNDESLGMHRLEVTCARCGGYLGHVFDDGPIDKTGKRYCINSRALNFRPEPPKHNPPKIVSS